MTVIEPTAGMLRDAFTTADGVMSPVMDDWDPAPLPVETSSARGVKGQLCEPVSAASVIASGRVARAEDDARAAVRDKERAEYAATGARMPDKAERDRVRAFFADRAALLDPWLLLTAEERDNHIQTCDGCDELCGDHRAEAWCDAYGRMVVILDNGYCPDCGRDHLNQHDNSDVKASER